jgi:hypothetical protein
MYFWVLHEKFKIKFMYFYNNFCILYTKLIYKTINSLLCLYYLCNLAIIR